MSDNALKEILNPRSIAIFGASNNPLKMGSIHLLNLLTSNYKGKIYPVHPREREIFGIKAYPSVSELPEAVDLAMIVLPTHLVAQFMEELGKKGVKRAIVISAGFKEIGEQGAQLQERLIQIARQYGMRFIGPNCIGVINTAIGLNTTFFRYSHHPGRVGLASQSGTYVTQILPYLERHGIGYSKAISLGNEADIDLVDALSYLADDDQTYAIGLYIEAIRRGREFLEVAREAVLKKPIVALYVGGTEAGKRAGKSHTAAMAGPDLLYDGVFKQAGIIRAPDVQSLFDWTWALACQPPLKGPNIAILSNSGGPATSMADAAIKWGLKVPEFPPELTREIAQLIPHTGSPQNPIDITFEMDFTAFAAKIPALLLAKDYIDGLVIYGLFGSSFQESVFSAARHIVKLDLSYLEKISQAAFEQFIQIPPKYGKPVVAAALVGREDDFVRGLQDNNIPCYLTPERAISAMSVLYKYYLIKNKFTKRTALKGTNAIYH